MELVMGSTEDTSWKQSCEWYDSLVGDDGHFYHQRIVLPGVFALLDLIPGQTLLDLACGQGIVERVLPPGFGYVGVDLAENLLKSAQERAFHPQRCEWIHGDATQTLPLSAGSADAALVCLALQNMDNPLGCFKETYRLLNGAGKLVIVLNHPAFRVPSLSGWQVDRSKRVQMRTTTRYMSALKLPLKVHPSQGSKSPIAWAYHLPISGWIQLASKAGFQLTWMEEWCSDKRSEGSMADVEDRARAEIPLFCTMVFSKTSSDS
jgi:ubiquinone/menaquinone biosynthesis C-methylase UbiE